MDPLTAIATAAGLGWASGMRLYAVLFFLGVLQHAGIYTLPPGLQPLAHPAVMAVSGFLFFVEFLADKVPGVDSLWDAVHTFIRIPAGAVLAAAAVASSDPGFAIAAGLLGASPVIGAEVVHAVREEMAHRLSDVVLRRTDLAAGGYPGDASVEACAAIVSRELGWSRARTDAEIDDLKAQFALVPCHA